MSIGDKVKRFLAAGKRHRLWRRIVSGMGIVVVFITTYMLILPAITMERPTYCGLEEHSHDKECYLACQETDNLAPPDFSCAGLTNYIHTHNEDCYFNGELVCPLDEIENHVHTDECFTEEKRLVCGMEESEGHTHDDSCYTEERLLICENEDPDHEHDDSCYEVLRDLTCTLEEGEGHTHDDSCYETVRTINCTAAQAHIHSADCYDENGSLICNLAEAQEHIHSASCMTKAAPADHVHTDACYGTELTCGKQEHKHTDECYVNPDDEEENGGGSGSGGSGESADDPMVGPSFDGELTIDDVISAAAVDLAEAGPGEERASNEITVHVYKSAGDGTYDETTDYNPYEGYTLKAELKAEIPSSDRTKVRSALIQAGLIDEDESATNYYGGVVFADVYYYNETTGEKKPLPKDAKVVVETDVPGKAGERYLQVLSVGSSNAQILTSDIDTLTGDTTDDGWFKNIRKFYFVPNEDNGSNTYCFITLKVFGGYVDNVTYTADTNAIIDGTEPFDKADGNGPGNDGGANNRIVRTFDTITYNLVASFQNRGLGSPSTKDPLRVEFSLDDKDISEAVFNVNEMAWLKKTWRIDYYDKKDGTLMMYEDSTGKYTAEGDPTSYNAMIEAGEAKSGVHDYKSGIKYQVLTGYLPVDAIPGTEDFALSIKVLACKNDDTIAPYIKAYFEKNELNLSQEVDPAETGMKVFTKPEPKQTNCILDTTTNKGLAEGQENSIVTVSAKPRYNYHIKNNTNLKHRAWFDLGDGEGYTKNAGDDRIYGRMFGYGVTLTLYNETDKDGATTDTLKQKGIKGIELPSGKVSFNINFETAKKNSEDTTQSGFTGIALNMRKQLIPIEAALLMGGSDDEIVVDENGDIVSETVINNELDDSSMSELNSDYGIALPSYDMGEAAPMENDDENNGESASSDDGDTAPSYNIDENNENTDEINDDTSENNAFVSDNEGDTLFEEVAADDTEYLAGNVNSINDTVEMALFDEEVYDLMATTDDDDAISKVEKIESGNSITWDFANCNTASSSKLVNGTDIKGLIVINVKDIVDDSNNKAWQINSNGSVKIGHNGGGFKIPATGAGTINVEFSSGSTSNLKINEKTWNDGAFTQSDIIDGYVPVTVVTAQITIKKITVTYDGGTVTPSEGTNSSNHTQGDGNDSWTFGATGGDVTIADGDPVADVTVNGTGAKLTAAGLTLASGNSIKIPVNTTTYTGGKLTVAKTSGSIATVSINDNTGYQFTSKDIEDNAVTIKASADTTITGITIAYDKPNGINYGEYDAGSKTWNFNVDDMPKNAGKAWLDDNTELENNLMFKGTSGNSYFGTNSLYLASGDSLTVPIPTDIDETKSPTIQIGTETAQSITPEQIKAGKIEIKGAKTISTIALKYTIKSSTPSGNIVKAHVHMTADGTATDVKNTCTPLDGMADRIKSTYANSTDKTKGTIFKIKDGSSDKTFNLAGGSKGFNSPRDYTIENLATFNFNSRANLSDGSTITFTVPKDTDVKSAKFYVFSRIQDYAATLTLKDTTDNKTYKTIMNVNGKSLVTTEFTDLIPDHNYELKISGALLFGGVALVEYTDSPDTTMWEAPQVGTLENTRVYVYTPYTRSGNYSDTPSIPAYQIHYQQLGDAVSGMNIFDISKMSTQFGGNLRTLLKAYNTAIDGYGTPNITKSNTNGYGDITFTIPNNNTDMKSAKLYVYGESSGSERTVTLVENDTEKSQEKTIPEADSTNKTGTVMNEFVNLTTGKEYTLSLQSTNTRVGAIILVLSETEATDDGWTMPLGPATADTAKVYVFVPQITDKTDSNYTATLESDLKSNNVHTQYAEDTPSSGLNIFSKPSLFDTDSKTDLTFSGPVSGYASRINIKKNYGKTRGTVTFTVPTGYTEFASGVKSATLYVIAASTASSSDGSNGNRDFVLTGTDDYHDGKVQAYRIDASDATKLRMLTYTNLEAGKNYSLAITSKGDNTSVRYGAFILVLSDKEVDTNDKNWYASESQEPPEVSSPLDPVDGGDTTHIPFLWDYDPNYQPDDRGKWDRNLDWDHNGWRTNSARDAGPYNYGYGIREGQSFTSTMNLNPEENITEPIHGSMGETDIYWGGDWEIVGEEAIKNKSELTDNKGNNPRNDALSTYKVEVSGFDFDFDNMHFPTNYGGHSTGSPDFSDQGFGSFIAAYSAGYFQIVVPFASNDSDTYRIRAKVTDFSANTLSGNTVGSVGKNTNSTDPEKDPDNVANQSDSTREIDKADLKKQFLKYNSFMARGATNINDKDISDTNRKNIDKFRHVVGQFVGDSWSTAGRDWDAAASIGDEIDLWGGFQLQEPADFVITAADVLQKFDPAAFEIDTAELNKVGEQGLLGNNWVQVFNEEAKKAPVKENSDGTKPTLTPKFNLLYGVYKRKPDESGTSASAPPSSFDSSPDASSAEEFKKAKRECYDWYDTYEDATVNNQVVSAVLAEVRDAYLVPGYYFNFRVPVKVKKDANLINNVYSTTNAIWGWVYDEDKAVDAQKMHGVTWAGNTEYATPSGYVSPEDCKKLTRTDKNDDNYIVTKYNTYNDDNSGVHPADEDRQRRGGTKKSGSATIDKAASDGSACSGGMGILITGYKSELSLEAPNKNNAVDNAGRPLYEKRANESPEYHIGNIATYATDGTNGYLGLDGKDTTNLKVTLEIGDGGVKIDGTQKARIEFNGKKYEVTIGDTSGVTIQYESGGTTKEFTVSAKLDTDSKKIVFTYTGAPVGAEPVGQSLGDIYVPTIVESTSSEAVKATAYITGEEDIRAYQTFFRNMASADVYISVQSGSNISKNVHAIANTEGGSGGTYDADDYGDNGKYIPGESASYEIGDDFVYTLAYSNPARETQRNTMYAFDVLGSVISPNDGYLNIKSIRVYSQNGKDESTRKYPAYDVYFTKEMYPTRISNYSTGGTDSTGWAAFTPPTTPGSGSYADDGTIAPKLTNSGNPEIKQGKDTNNGIHNGKISGTTGMYFVIGNKQDETVTDAADPAIPAGNTLYIQFVCGIDTSAGTDETEKNAIDKSFAGSLLINTAYFSRPDTGGTLVVANTTAAKNVAVGRTISGIVWTDDNKNGRQDADEARLQGVQVALYQKTADGTYTQVTKDILEDPIGEDGFIKTDETGAYAFNYLPKGDYVVAFKYNNGSAEVTTYKARGVDPDDNNDGVKIYSADGGAADKVKLDKALEETLRDADFDYAIKYTSAQDYIVTSSPDDIYNNSDGNYIETFANMDLGLEPEGGPPLPETGGMGTDGIKYAGIAIVCGAALMLMWEHQRKITK